MWYRACSFAFICSISKNCKAKQFKSCESLVDKCLLLNRSIAYGTFEMYGIPPIVFAIETDSDPGPRPLWTIMATSSWTI
jgi:hypothetical protein